MKKIYFIIWIYFVIRNSSIVLLVLRHSTLEDRNGNGYNVIMIIVHNVSSVQFVIISKNIFEKNAMYVHCIIY